MFCFGWSSPQAVASDPLPPTPGKRQQDQKVMEGFVVQHLLRTNNHMSCLQAPGTFANSMPLAHHSLIFTIDAMILHSTLSFIHSTLPFIHEGSACWWCEEFEARRQARPTNDFSCNTVRPCQDRWSQAKAEPTKKNNIGPPALFPLVGFLVFVIFRKIRLHLTHQTYIIALLKADQVEGSILS